MSIPTTTCLANSNKYSVANCHSAAAVRGKRQIRPTDFKAPERAADPKDKECSSTAYSRAEHWKTKRRGEQVLKTGHSKEISDMSNEHLQARVEADKKIRTDIEKMQQELSGRSR